MPDNDEVLKAELEAPFSLEARRLVWDTLGGMPYGGSAWLQERGPINNLADLLHRLRLLSEVARRGTDACNEKARRHEALLADLAAFRRILLPGHSYR